MIADRKARWAKRRLWLKTPSYAQLSRECFKRSVTLKPLFPFSFFCWNLEASLLRVVRVNLIIVK